MTLHDSWSGADADERVHSGRWSGRFALCRPD